MDNPPRPTKREGDTRTGPPAIDMLTCPVSATSLPPTPQTGVIPAASGNSPGAGRTPPLREAIRHTPTTNDDKRKKRSGYFPQSLSFWDSKSVPFPPGAKRINQPVLAFQATSLQPVPLSEGPRLGVGGREWALPGEECSETRNSKAGVGLRRRI